MSLPDTSAIDAAVLGVLSADPQLKTLMPDGVWMDMPQSPNASRFVVVQQLHHEDEYVLQAHAWERITYLVKAVALSTTGGDVKTAAYRIHQLLQDARLVMTGYLCMLSQRVERIRYSEIEDVTDARWNHRGGQYEVFATAAQAPVIRTIPNWTVAA